MAKNTGNDFRRGAVKARTQFQHANGDWQKRDERTGQFMERKADSHPFKGVAKEPDGRKRATGSVTQVREPSSGKSLPLKGYGALRGEFSVKKGVDLTKPISEQVSRVSSLKPSQKRK